jgi:CMP-N-acetylneuraminic acid synthetase
VFLPFRTRYQKIYNSRRISFQIPLHRNYNIWIGSRKVELTSKVRFSQNFIINLMDSSEQSKTEVQFEQDFNKIYGLEQ